MTVPFVPRRPAAPLFGDVAAVVGAGVGVRGGLCSQSGGAERSYTVGVFSADRVERGGSGGRGAALGVGSTAALGFTAGLRVSVSAGGSGTSPGSVRFFFFQAEDGIRDLIVTGVQTCALPI